MKAPASDAAEPDEQAQIKTTEASASDEAKTDEQAETKTARGASQLVRALPLENCCPFKLSLLISNTRALWTLRTPACK